MQDTETSHFWVGHMPKRMAGKYFVETYAEDRGVTPLSMFARDQRVKYYERLAKIAQTPEQKRRIADGLASISTSDNARVREEIPREVRADRTVSGGAVPESDDR